MQARNGSASAVIVPRRAALDHPDSLGPYPTPHRGALLTTRSESLRLPNLLPAHNAPARNPIKSLCMPTPQ